MKIAICDDNDRCRQQLNDLLQEYAALHPEAEVSVAVFDCGAELLEEAAAIGGYDVCLLDIIMPNLNGIDLARRLRSAGDRCRIVYLTSSEEYAVDAFRVKAHDYLLKPIDRTTLFSVLDELVTLSAVSEKSILVKTRENIVRLHYNTILYAQLTKRAIRYYCIDGTVVDSTSIRTTFAEGVKVLLQDRRFTLCGVGTVVNLHHITSIENGTVTFRNNIKLFPGVKANRELRSVWLDYWFDKENAL